MQLKVLVQSSYQVLGVVSRDGGCDAEAFLVHGEEATKAMRSGLFDMLYRVAEVGSQGLVAAWSHEVDKKNKIFRLEKGSLRFFYFRGEGRQIMVCTGGARKKAQKADKSEVAKAIALRNQYFSAVAAGKITVV